MAFCEEQFNHVKEYGQLTKLMEGKLQKRMNWISSTNRRFLNCDRIVKCMNSKSKTDHSTPNRSVTNMGQFETHNFKFGCRSRSPKLTPTVECKQPKMKTKKI
ncbi:hypothetical protein MRX96_048786 [Rhipicephalus microplus]